MVSEELPHKPGSQDPKDQLDEELAHASEKGLRIAHAGRNIAVAGQAFADLADATRAVVHVITYLPNIEYALDTWHLANSQADILLANLSEGHLQPFSVTNGSAAFSATDLTVRATIQHTVPFEFRPQAELAVANLEDVLSRSASVKDVADLMKRFCLHQSTQPRKSPLELFLTAHNAFEGPVDTSVPVSTSLIPMREAIRLTIEYFLRRRPKQEKTRSEWNKVISIGTQLKRDDVPAQLVTTWASQWKTVLATSLSPAKQANVPRDEWRRRLLQSTIFLQGFLNGIDPAKLAR